MKTLHFLVIVVCILVVVYITRQLMIGDESYTSRKFFDVAKHVAPTATDKTVTKIPRTIIRCAASDQLDEVFRESIEKCIKLNPEYEHVFFTNADCDMFMAVNFSGPVYDSYNSLVPGAYKADLFRLCYLFKNGGVYIDSNKTLLVPLKDVIPADCSFFSVMDLKSCDIFQAFIAAAPGLPFFEKCINAIVDNVRNRYYGPCDLSITGPALLGVVFADHYGFCVTKSGEYEAKSEKIKFAILKRDFLFRDEYVYDDSRRILDLNRRIRNQMNRFWQYQTSIPHYSHLWKARKVYEED